MLVQAAELILPVYQDQERQIIESGGLYPKGTDKELLAKAIKEDPSLLSPLCVVEEENGNLKCVAYHIKYQNLLKPVAQKLKEASSQSDNKEFATFLTAQAHALLNGTYEAALAASTKVTGYPLDINIGPVEHDDQRLFFNKAAYQAWVGIIDSDATEQFDYYKTIVQSARRKSLKPDERHEISHAIRGKVLDVLIFTGHMARTMFVGINMPTNLDFIQKYGSEITLFKQMNELRLTEQIRPTLEKAFSENFRNGYSLQDIARGNLSYIALHEIAHDYLYYKDAPKNLQDLLVIIYELAATVLGIRMAGALLLKDVISNKELESMIVSYICRSLHLKELGSKMPDWASYSTGGTIFINYLLKNGAMMQHNGLAIPNFMKIFVSIEELFFELEQILSSGTRKDAEAFIRLYRQSNVPA